MEGVNRWQGGSESTYGREGGRESWSLFFLPPSLLTAWGWSPRGDYVQLEVTACQCISVQAIDGSLLCPCVKEGVGDEGRY